MINLIIFRAGWRPVGGYHVYLEPKIAVILTLELHGLIVYLVILYVKHIYKRETNTTENKKRRTKWM